MQTCRLGGGGGLHSLACPAATQCLLLPRKAHGSAAGAQHARPLPGASPGQESRGLLKSMECPGGAGFYPALAPPCRSRREAGSLRVSFSPMTYTLQPGGRNSQQRGLGQLLPTSSWTGPSRGKGATGEQPCWRRRLWPFSFYLHRAGKPGPD